MLTTLVSHNAMAMHYENLPSLEAYLSEVEMALLCKGRRVPVKFPASAVAPWDRETLERANQELLRRVSRGANLYAIYTADCGA